VPEVFCSHEWEACKLCGLNCVVVTKQQSEEAEAPSITVEQSSRAGPGRPRHTRITIHRLGSGGGANPFQEYDSFSWFY